MTHTDVQLNQKEGKDPYAQLMIVVPSLNPDGKLLQVVDGMIEAGFSQVLLVDDGSDELHRKPFLEAEQRPQCTVLRHEKNRGKGRALKTAFSYISRERKDILGVITMDGDNQHKPLDARNLADGLLADPARVMMGVRDFKEKHVPLHNRLGNTITSLVFRMLCGIALSDTQTGLRAFSAEYLPRFIQVEGERFEYETNMLLFMKTAGIGFREISIETVYIENNATSHFNPLTDSAKIYGPILRFAGGSAASAGIDPLLFTLLAWLMRGTSSLDRQILMATVGARGVSSLFNYAFNRRAVFSSDEPKRITLLRYYLLCLVQMLISYKGVSLLVSATGFLGIGKTLIKLVVDSILFLMTFQIQREWVFKKKKTERYPGSGAKQ
jgi:glycosyltransferase involved in cell wall biosynthesis